MKTKVRQRKVRQRESAERALRLVLSSIATLDDQLRDGRVRRKSVEAFLSRANEAYRRLLENFDE